MRFTNIPEFIKEHITYRKESFFSADVENNGEALGKAIGNKSVLVIGGGGTIGSNFIKAVLKYRPAKVVVVDSNENSLTELVRDIRSTPDLFVPEKFITYPVNLGSELFSKIYAFHKPFDIIANFSAHKHVRSEKDIYSVEAMIRNNIFHAYSLLKNIEADKPSHFFCVSTDKAANPVNIMGASKKLMEDVVLDFSSHLQCTTARFANVAFSNGSLLDGFVYRMMKRQPLSVPRDVRRYFVSPEESGEICMLSCMLGETGDIFFPKLSEDKLTGFLEITERYVTANGYTMDVCSSEEEAKGKARLLTNESRSYPVYVFDTNTTGEKMFEEFYTKEEKVDMESYLSLGVVKYPGNEQSRIHEAMNELEELFRTPVIQKKAVVDIMLKYIPTFEHVEKGVGLDSKM